LLYVGVTFLIVNAASNVLNQVTDVEEDKLSKPWRPIPKGHITADEALTLALFLYVIGIARAYTVSIPFGFIVTLIALLTIAYSLEPIRLKRRFVLNNLTLSVARGYLPALAIWSWCGIPTQQVHLFGLGLFLFLIGTTSSKDFVDVEADKKVGVKTLPIVLGRRKSLAVLLPFLFLPYLPFTLVGLGVLLHLLPFSIVLAFFFLSEGSVGKMEYSVAWVLGYILLFLYYLGWLSYVLWG